MGFVSRRSQVNKDQRNTAEQLVTPEEVEPMELHPTRSIVRVALGKFADKRTGNLLGYK